MSLPESPRRRASSWWRSHLWVHLPFDSPGSRHAVPFVLRLPLVYLTVSVTWILVSDRALEALVPTAQAPWVGSVKGLGFVVVTTLIIFELTRRHAQRVARARAAQEDAFTQVLATLARALDVRDSSTADHSRRVAVIASAVARHLGVSGVELEDLRRGAALHDIGKMGVPDAVLSFEGPLDAAQRKVMEQHPMLAYELLSPVDFLASALDIPFCHHERWDGSGYPQGLAGEAIPFAARVFAPVDVYDALTSARPYRDPLGHDEALAFVVAGSGSLFDPQVVAAFAQVMAAGPPVDGVWPPARP